VYIPLGGNQRGARRTSINLFLTMLLGGLWHGAAWTFVAWGAIHGGAMTVERSLAAKRERDRELAFAGGWGDEHQRDAAVLVGAGPGGPAGTGWRDGGRPVPPDDPPPESFRTQVVRWLITFHVVCLAWVFFRAETLGDAFELLWRLISAPGSGPVVKPMLLFVIVAMIASQFVPSDVVDRVQARFSLLPFIAQGAALGVGLLVIDALGPVGVAPFIYFQF
jgi:D-alanyl-lipoteichoic acid acyltransferase DltB (MBOAT superfamily)